MMQANNNQSGMNSTSNQSVSRHNQNTQFNNPNNSQLTKQIANSSAQNSKNQMLFNQNQYQQSPSQATNASQASNLAVKPQNNYMNQNNLGQFLLKKGSSGTSLLHAIDIHNRKPAYAAQG